MYSQMMLDQNAKAFAAYNPLSDGIDAAFRQGKYAGVIDTPKCPHPEGTSNHDWWNRGFDYGTDCLAHGLNPYSDCAQSESEQDGKRYKPYRGLIMDTGSSTTSVDVGSRRDVASEGHIPS